MKKIPKFKNEDEEREFWATHDSTEYIDWSKAQEMQLLKSFENGEWKTVPNFSRERKRHQAYARAAVRKWKRVK